MVYLLSGIALVAAMISGIAGIGGGAILIAAMFALGLSPVVAVPLHAAVQLVSNASRTLAYLPHVDRRAAAWFTIATLPMPFVVAPMVAHADPDLIRLALATCIFLSLLPRPRNAPRMSLRARMLSAGLLNGSVGPVVGATGFAIAPFFLHPDWRKETTVGTLALCQAVGHAVKIAAFASFGFNAIERWDLLLPLVVAVVAGTAIGRLLMHRVSPRRFVQLFRAILIVLALRLAWTGLAGLL